MSERAARERRDALAEELRAGHDDRRRFLAELADSVSATTGELAAGGGDDATATALAALRDKTLPAATRVEVLSRLGGGLTRNDEAIEVLLAIVQDSGDNPEVRAAALDALGSAAFQVARFRPHEDAYRSALRSLIQDDDENLREVAISTLALQHDPEIQQTLLAGLRGEGELPVPREQAIQLLAEDDHLDNLPLLRELYESGDDDARLEAVRLMGSYTDASDLLERALRDKDETTEVRRQSAASLRNLAPERFDAVAKEIATDGSDYAEIRTLSLTTLEHLGDADAVYGDEDFIQRLGAVGGDESAPEVAKGARSLVERGRRR
jgi:tetratricopeptide (TPR) repeat protein